MPKITLENAFKVFKHKLPFQIGNEPADGPWMITAFDTQLKRVFITLHKYNARWYAWEKLSSFPINEAGKAAINTYQQIMCDMYEHWYLDRVLTIQVPLDFFKYNDAHFSDWQHKLNVEE